MVQVNLPPGCKALAFEDGTRYVAPRSGGRIDVTHDHAAAIDKISGNGDAGLVTGKNRVFGALTKPGRWCTSCQPARLWQPWSKECPRCGSATVPENDAASA